MCRNIFSLMTAATPSALKERRLYLQEEDSAEILDALDEYLSPAEDA